MGRRGEGTESEWGSAKRKKLTPFGLSQLEISFTFPFFFFFFERSLYFLPTRMYTFIQRFLGRKGRQEAQSSARPSSPKGPRMQQSTAAAGMPATAATAATATAAAVSRRPLEPGFAFDGLDPTSFLVRY